MFDRHQDLKTIRRCKRGEEAAFAEILDRYRGAIYNLCYRMTRNAEDARDLGQEVFIKVFSLLDRFDENYAFSSWLFRIATNHCIDHLRRNRLRFLSLDGGVGPDGEEFEFQLPDSGPGARHGPAAQGGPGKAGGGHRRVAAPLPGHHPAAARPAAVLRGNRGDPAIAPGDGQGADPPGPQPDPADAGRAVL